MGEYLSGTDGAVSGILGGKATAWAGTLSRVVGISTGLGDDFQTREYLTGSMSGRISFLVHSSSSGSANDPANFVLNKVKASLVLTQATGKTFTFNSTLSNVEFGAEVDRFQVVTANFDSDGTIARAY